MWEVTGDVMVHVIQDTGLRRVDCSASALCLCSSVPV